MATGGDEIHHPLVARIIDLAMRPVHRFRERVVPGASGRVLEIGAGTGLNLPLYREVSEVVAVEPDPAMRARAEERVAAVPVSVVDARAEALPFDDHSFDTIVMTFVLCTIQDPHTALAEARRVLAPSGKLLFAEHVRADGRVASGVQRIMTPAWRHFSGGCHLDRDAAALLDGSGFTREATERRGSGYTLTPIVYGRARSS